MEDKYKDWEITTNRFVAFIDIMGFKDIVQRKIDKEVYENFKKISDYSNNLNKLINSEYFANQKNIEKGTIYITIFSDSIVIFSKNNNEKTLKAFLVSVISIFNIIIQIGWGAKGVISYGNMTVDIKKSIFFGQPLIDSYLSQENLHYYGVLFHHTAERYINENKIVYKRGTFNCNTPIKSGKVNSMNLNWLSFLPETNEVLGSNIIPTKAKETHIKVLNSLMDKIRLNVSGDPRKYVDNTINVFNDYIETIYPNLL